MRLATKPANPAGCRLQLPTVELGATIRIEVQGGGASVLNNQAEDLLAAMVLQAMHDGMTKLRLGINRKTKKAFLEYGGLVGQPAPEWWDMTPPPSGVWPSLVRTAISFVSLNAGSSFEGAMEVMKNGRAVVLQFVAHDQYSFELSWSPGPSGR
jgi:hypothetical protein